MGESHRSVPRVCYHTELADNCHSEMAVDLSETKMAISDAATGLISLANSGIDGDACFIKASKPEDPMEEDLKCSLCQCLLDEPKDLNCPHVFCLKCLKHWVKEKSTKDGDDITEITCPDCEEKTPIPKDGLEALKTNVRLKSMSTKYAARKANISMCYEHNEIKHFFCLTCAIPACSVCLKINHESLKHDVKGLKEVSQKMKEQMAHTLENVQLEIARDKQYFRNMASEKTQRIKKASEESIRQIKDRVEEMIRDIETTGHAIEERVREIEKDYLLQLEAESIKAEKQEAHVTGVLVSMKGALGCAPDHDYVAQHAQLLTKLKNTTISRHRVTIPKINEEDFHLHPGPALTSNIFGRLPLRVCNATLVDQFGMGIFKKAQGIASTRTGLIAIADTDSNKVCVYQRNMESGKYEFNFWLCASGGVTGTVERPFDVAIVSCGKMFVTSDRMVSVFSSTGQFERSFTTNSKGPSRITSTDDDNILVADDRKRIVTLHHPSGELLRRYFTRNTAINIVTNGNLIAVTNQSHGNVCVIDAANGKEILEFQVGPGEATTGVCFLDCCQSLLVSVGTLGQTGQDRIEQYCCISGRLISVVLTGLYAPMCLTLLNDNQLAVADVGRVQIYNLEFSDDKISTVKSSSTDEKSMKMDQ